MTHGSDRSVRATNDFALKAGFSDMCGAIVSRGPDRTNPVASYSVRSLRT
jgi:hypothetical protein